MRDLGIQKPFIQEIDPSKKQFKNYYGLRKLFRDYLRKLNVAFFDTCCLESNVEDAYPVRYNGLAGRVTYFDGSDWQDTQTGAIAGLSTFNAPVVENASSSSPINATATATATQLITGLITSTSAAATSITLPTATLLGTALGAVKGTSFEFIVDNSAGANTVTIILGAGMVTATPIITGGATLTVPATAAGVGIFRVVFKSATTAVVFRIG